MTVCVSVCFLCMCGCGLPIFTAGEDERTGVFVHWEIMELQLALCIDGHPVETEKEMQRDRKKQR